MAADILPDAVWDEVKPLLPPPPPPSPKGGRPPVDDRAALRGVRFVKDATVDGAGTYASGTGELRGRFTVRVTGRRTPIRVTVSWRQSTPTAHAGSARWNILAAWAHATANGVALRLPAP